MSIYEILEQKAKQGFVYFFDYIYNSNDLMLETNETDDDESEIEVFVLDDDECSEFVGRFYFNNNGEYIEKN